MAATFCATPLIVAADASAPAESVGVVLNVMLLVPAVLDTFWY